MLGLLSGVVGGPARRVMFMSQSSSKPTAKVAARGRPHPRGFAVGAKPAVDIRPQTSRDDPRPLPEGNVNNLASSEDLPNYAQWAGFMDGAQEAEFGFGAYFVDEPSGPNGAQPSASATRYTWTPSGRR
jgi:hypothetical protein